MKSRKTVPLSYQSSVAVVIPKYKERMTSEEATSLTHLEHFLSNYDRYIVAPKSLRVDLSNFRIKRFDDQYFSTVYTYSKLLLSRQFYEKFATYRYILIYQLDCLVLSDQLAEWCSGDLDYVGAPWFESQTDPTRGFSRVGNGGFSLRKVSSFLKVLDSKRFVEERVSYLKDVLFSKPADVDTVSLRNRFMKRLRVLRHIRRGVEWYSHHYTLNEDHFWSDRARLFYPGFKIAPVDVALRFSFERFPRYCFERNNYQLPFGCHAWTRWDREFWETHLQRY